LVIPSLYRLRGDIWFWVISSSTDFSNSHLSCHCNFDFFFSTLELGTKTTVSYTDEAQHNEITMFCCRGPPCLDELNEYERDKDKRDMLIKNGKNERVIIRARVIFNALAICLCPHIYF